STRVGALTQNRNPPKRDKHKAGPEVLAAEQIGPHTLLQWSSPEPRVAQNATPEQRVCRRSFPSLGHCGAMPDSFTTFPHLANSDSMNLPKSAVLILINSAPS